MGVGLALIMTVSLELDTCSSFFDHSTRLFGYCFPSRTISISSCPSLLSILALNLTGRKYMSPSIFRCLATICAVFLSEEMRCDRMGL